MSYDGRIPQARGGLLDVTGDGLLDLVHAYESESGAITHNVWRNKGTGWELDNRYQFPAPLIQHRDGQYDQTQLTFVDLNQDGVSDLIPPGSGTAGWLHRIGDADYALPESVTQTQSGLGFITRVEMKPGSYDGLYTKSTGAVYPVMDAPAIGSVVHRALFSNTIGGLVAKTYQYGGMRFDMQRRGSLGFPGRKSMTNVLIHGYATSITKAIPMRDYLATAKSRWRVK